MLNLNLRIILMLSGIIMVGFIHASDGAEKHRARWRQFAKTQATKPRPPAHAPRPSKVPAKTAAPPGTAPSTNK